MADQRKLVRVEMEFDDGTIQTMEGDDAQEWLKLCEGPIVLQQARGYPNPELGEINKKWKVTKKTT